MTTRYRFSRFRAPLHTALTPSNDNHLPGEISPKGPRPVSKLTDVELDNLVENFTKRGVGAGGHYTLKEVRKEILSRICKGIDGMNVVRQIIKLAAKSHDYKTTYGDLYCALWPNSDWEGHGSMTKAMLALRAAIHFCADNSLPMFSTLVVPTNRRRLSEKAKTNIYETCRDIGMEVGTNPSEFVIWQANQAAVYVQKAGMTE